MTDMMDKILEASNLSRAVCKVRKNHGAAGIDGMGTEQLLPFFAANGKKIKKALRNGTYKPMPVRQVKIPKPDGKKRTLGIPTVRDRVIQQAVLQILTPIYEPRFSDASYGYRPKRNPHGAVLKCRSYLNDGYVWAVDLDVEQFFDTVNQQKIMKTLSKTVRDGRLLSLVWKTMRAGAIYRGKFQKTRQGVPQGGPLSPLLANILLDRLDKELERTGQKFVRYADDMVILCKSKAEAKNLLRRVTGFLENELRLKINREKTAVVYANKIQFLGFGFYKHGDAFRLRVHPKALRRMKTRIDALLLACGGNSRLAWTQKLRQYIRGWIGYYKLADLDTTLKSVDEYMQRQFRFRIKALWEETVAEMQAPKGKKSARSVCGAGTAFLQSGTFAELRPLLSKRQLETGGFPFFSAHYAAIAG